MTKYSDKKIIFLIGPIGSGKGTQADNIAKEFSFFHFDTSAFLRRYFKEATPENEEARKEIEIYNGGELNSPPFVTKIVLKEAESILGKFSGLVFSGSPRTVYEFENEVAFFENLVEKENINFFYINVSKEESIKRNSNRLVCEKNRHPIPNLSGFEKIRASGVCPQDGSKLIKRGLDEPNTIAKRYDVYLRDTKPVLDKVKEIGYKIIKINGDQSIEKVFEDINKALSNKQ